MTKHYFFHITGIVQGVGFRPFIYNLAQEMNLSGTVCNTSDGVYIHVEGDPITLDVFAKRIQESPPPLSQIHGFSITELPVEGMSDFVIVKSNSDVPKQTLVSPDAAICADCRHEILNSKDRRFLYPFTNCTNCGPRYTIIRDIPYDRALTTMSSFSMCPECNAEYHDPADRRFHAQPNACPVCGPQIDLYSMDQKKVPGFWLDQFTDKILDGAIFGIKSLGGFHLACLGDNPAPIEKLRKRKSRPHRPFAIMCRDLDTIRSFAEVSQAEEKLLTSPQAPIVLLRIRKKSPALDAIAPQLSTVGVMLPYTPLHYLLFGEHIKTLVMTSGNQKSLPLTYRNDHAFEELNGLADYLLVHDRDIQNRCDDSVVSVFKDIPYFYRRSRGYTPLPITIPFESRKPVLALGSDMRNTYCLLKGNQAFLGPHIGDLYNQETVDYFVRSYQDMKIFVDVHPTLTVHDLHPTYMSTKVASQSAVDPDSLVPVQHHHAHMAACMAENGLDGRNPVLGVVLDGTGYGTDKNIWGFEILHGDYQQARRLYHLKNVPLPGGDAAVLHPWRMACSYLWQYTSLSNDFIKNHFSKYSQQIDSLYHLWNAKVNSPLTSSCGRFFDAVSAMLLICTEITYDAQAAILLMEAANTNLTFDPYPFLLNGDEISPEPTIQGIIRDIQDGLPVSTIAARFHHTIASMVLNCLKNGREKTGCSRVVLSGGVFQNEWLLSILLNLLQNDGFSTYIHRQVPTNDGGIAFGQAVIAAAKLNDSLITEEESTCV